MENLDILKKKDAPEIHFNAETGVLSIDGNSYPENPLDLYEKLNKWLKKYMNEIKGQLILNTKINYLNTSSSKCILDILEALERYYKSGAKVQVNWYYEEDDEDMLQTGEELCEDLELPWKMIAY